MTPETVLVRARHVTVRIGDADDVRIFRGEDRFETSPHALAILDAFAHPRSIADVLAALATDKEHWMEISSAVLQLARAGILRPPGVRDEGDVERGFARPTIHVVMLDDERRTNGFLNALEEVVRESDVVLDIGTGTGILATRAAQLGARRVYAVESSGIADAAETVFSANHVADRVTLVRGRSTQLRLPERANVLVTEILGNDPLDERLLEVVSDAKARLLTPDATLVPSGVEIVAIPVIVPRRVLERHVFTQARVDAWNRAYAVDLSPLLEVRSSSQAIMVRTDEIRSWERAAKPITLVNVDLRRDFDVVLEARASFVADRDVDDIGIALAFRATLAPEIVLSTVPEDVHPADSWRYALWPALDRPTLKKGETATIHYAYNRGTTTLRVI